MRGYVAPSALALVHLGLGEKRRAVELLESALVARDPLLLVFLVRDPLLEKEWQTPALAPLRARAGLPVA